MPFVTLKPSIWDSPLSVGNCWRATWPPASQRCARLQQPNPSSRRGPTCNLMKSPLPPPPLQLPCPRAPPLIPLPPGPLGPRRPQGRPPPPLHRPRRLWNPPPSLPWPCRPAFSPPCPARSSSGRCWPTTMAPNASTLRWSRPCQSSSWHSGPTARPRLGSGVPRRIPGLRTMGGPARHHHLLVQRAQSH